MSKYPQGWSYEPLSSIGGVAMCKRILKEQTKSEGDVPFFKIGTFGKTPDAFISRNLFEEFRSKYSYPNPGDILVSAAGTIGRTVVFDGRDAYFQDSNIVWIPNDESKVLNQYLYYWYKVIVWRTENGGTVERLYNDNFKASLIAYPPLPEQRRIAAVLSDMDALIASLEKRIAKKKAIQQGTMQELLSGRRRLKGFEGEWKKVSPNYFLKSVSTTGAPVKWKAASIPGRKPIPAFSASGQDCWLDECMFTGDGIIVSAVGSRCGKCFLASGRWSVVANTHVLQGMNGADMRFFWYILNNEDWWIKAGTGQPYVLIAASLAREKLYPEPSEQRAIASVLSDMDEEIAALERKLVKYRALKQGMMQDLLTGKVRLMRNVE